MTTTSEAPKAQVENGNATSTAVAVRPAREVRVVQDNGPLAYLFDTARYEHMQRVAGGMAAASLIPQHLRGKTDKETLANCYLVVNQSIRWGFDPFAVAPETYAIGGKLGYQGKLIAAVVNSRAGLARPLGYWYNGAKGDALACVVYGFFKSENGNVLALDKDGRIVKAVTELLTRYAANGDDAATENELDALNVKVIRISVGEARTENKMWTKDPKQKLRYSGAIKFARAHVPEIALGVLTDDDLERIEHDQREQHAERMLPAAYKQVPDNDPNAPTFGAVTVAEEKSADPAPAATVIAETTVVPVEGAHGRVELSKAQDWAETNQVDPGEVIDALSLEGMLKTKRAKTLDALTDKELAHIVLYGDTLLKRISEARDLKAQENAGAAA